MKAINMTRKSGILMHISSLPSQYGIGDMGSGAYGFADFLEKSGQTLWQILPLTPTKQFCGNSPYVGSSAFAGNPLLISPGLLVEDGLQDRSDIVPVPAFPGNRTDYTAVVRYKRKLLARAHTIFSRRGGASNEEKEFDAFVRENASWLEPYAEFRALKTRFDNTPWTDWPDEIRDRAPGALAEVRRESEEGMWKARFRQFLFFDQWSRLRQHCHDRGVEIIGDLPIYVAHDSADVWANRHLFKLRDNGERRFAAGVPPDHFSGTGQLWGNPVYDWEAHEKDGFSWWSARLEHNLRMYDMVRIDHFRGLEAYWEVDAEHNTAEEGKWVKAPGEALLAEWKKRFGELPIIAEDLGSITDDVRRVKERFGLPGMKVLQFAFGEDVATNPYAPHNHTPNCVVYTGTHDNNTTRGWYRRDIDPETKRRVKEYLGRGVTHRTVHERMMRIAMMSIADTAIIPMQDVLGYDSWARMNRPGVGKNNWEWRMEKTAGELTDIARNLARMAEISGRPPQ